MRRWLTLPVVLHKGAVLEVAGSEEAALRADGVVVGEAGEHFGRGVAGEVGVAEVEVALAGDGAEEGDVATDSAAAELEGVVPAGVGDGVVELVGVFGHGVAAVVAGVLEVGVAADEGAAAEVGVAVGVDDAKAGGDGLRQRRRDRW